MRIEDLDTPALLIDLDIMEKNLRKVADYAELHQLRLRPHTKTHKVPELGSMQCTYGAVGLTVAKVGEAEVMAHSDALELLVAYPVIGNQKLDRLMRVAEEVQVTVALDSEFAAEQLSCHANEAGLTIGVLVELDTGFHRVGVRADDVLLLAETIESLPGLRFDGLNFYPGNISNLNEKGLRELGRIEDLLGEVIERLSSRGLECSVVSGGSTPTLFHSHRISHLNEIRPGTYIFNDKNTVSIGACGISDCAGSILTTVVSTSVSAQAIIDGGTKTFSSDGPVSGIGYGYIVDNPGAVFKSMNEEHGYIDIRESNKPLRLGDRIRVIPNHICTAVNLHEYIYGIRGDEVEKTWKVEGRGKLA